MPLVLLLSLAALPQDSVTISGTVRNEVNDDPIPRVLVSHDNLLVAETDEDGAFRATVSAPRGGAVILAFRRLGFAPRAVTIDVTGGAPVPLDLTLRPMPTVLEEITVDGRTFTIRNPDLVGFYNRREEGHGLYLTQFEIDRATSFDLSPYLRRLRPQNQRECMIGAELAIYLDGIRVPDFDTVNRIVAPRQVGGMEMYREEDKALLPPEFITPGVTCGTLLVWTRNPRPPSSSLVGVHGTSAWGGPDGRRTYLGLRFAFRLRDPPSSLALLFSFDAAARSARDDIWRVFVTPVLRPLGVGTGWYAGAGLAILKPSQEADVGLHPALVSGLETRVGPLRPFLEGRLVRVRDPVFTLVTGLALTFGGGT